MALPHLLHFPTPRSPAPTYLTRPNLRKTTNRHRPSFALPPPHPRAGISAPTSTGVAVLRLPAVPLLLLLLLLLLVSAFLHCCCGRTRA